MHERDKDEIRHYVDATFRAYIEKDWAVIHTGHTKDWCGFTVDARSIIRGSEVYVTEAETTLESVELIDYEMIEIDYIFHGATCVVPYIARLRGTWATGSLFEIKLRALDVYVQQNGNWHQVAGNVSLHPDSMVDPQIAAVMFKRSSSA